MVYNTSREFETNVVQITIITFMTHISYKIITNYTAHYCLINWETIAYLVIYCSK